MSIKKIAGLCALCAIVFLPVCSSASQVELQAPAESASSLETVIPKLGRPGCDFRYEEGPGYKKFTDQGGHQYTLRFDSNDRLAEFDMPSGDGIIVYAGDTGVPIGLINKNTGAVLKIRPGRGPDWYRALLAQGKLPTVDKIIEQVCGKKPGQKLLGPDGEIIPDGWEDYLTQDYWMATFEANLNDWWADFLRQVTRTPCDDYDPCMQGCSDQYINWLLVSIAVAAGFAAADAPVSGAAAGTIGAFIGHAVYAECIGRCAVLCN
jgi:hypothetical protein